MKNSLIRFFAFLKSLQVVFVAFIFQKFIDFAQKPQGSLIKLTVFAVCGLLIFGIVGFIYQYFYYKIIEEINLNLKSASANYLVNNYADHNEIDSSFMTNDLKQIETNSIEAELSIISDLIQFLAAVISAFVSSWIIALVFLIASFTPAVIQSVFGPKIEKILKSGKNPIATTPTPLLKLIPEQKWLTSMMFNFQWLTG